MGSGGNPAWIGPSSQPIDTGFDLVVKTYQISKEDRPKMNMQSCHNKANVHLLLKDSEVEF